jgi:F5/8 type C domain-containing protein/Big-like domain-containing protein
VGGVPTLPMTVTAVAEHGETVSRPVTWDEPASGLFDEPGVVTVTGRADAGDGTLPAVVRVQVTAPVEANTALSPGASATATFTEPGYSASGLVNGDLTDKAWSNWQPNTWNPSDTLTVWLPEERDVSGVAVHFYRDGRDSHAATLAVQARDAETSWVDVSGPVTVPTGTPSGPVVDVDFPATRTDAVRVVLTAPNGGYMTASEIEVFAPAPGVSSDAAAASISLDGDPIPGFDPEVTAYRVRASGRPELTATAHDPYAVVDVRQPTGSNRTGVVTVTSEDGSRTRTYTVELTR